MIDVDYGNSSDAHVARPASTRSAPAFGDGGATATARSKSMAGGADTASLKPSCCRPWKGAKTFDAAGIFGVPRVLFVHMKPTHEAQNPMVYGTHRRTPFMNNTMSQAFAVPECTALRRGTSGRTSSRCSTESARCVLLQQRMLQAPTHTNRQGCERAGAGRDWFLRQAGWWRSWESQYRVSPPRGPITLLEAGQRS